MDLIYATGIDSITPPAPGERYVGVLGLIEELELRLGLAGLWPSEFERRLACLNTLRSRAGKNAFWAQSYAADPLGVASELLLRRDEVVAAGARTHIRDSAGVPSRIAELSQIDANLPDDSPVKHGPADRMDALVRAMAAGERPVGLHALRSLEPRDLLPTGVDRLFTALERTGVPVSFESLKSAAPRCSRLGAAQRLIAGEVDDGATVAGDDGTLVFATSQTANDGIELVTRFLRDRGPGETGEIAVVTDAAHRWYLAEALAADGSPSTGATDDAGMPDLAALSLIPCLITSPRDPQKLVSLLMSGASPVDSSLSWRLARALESEPGIGSASWEDARRRWEEKTTDRAARAAGFASYERWLGAHAPPRTPAGSPLPAPHVIALYERASDSYRSGSPLARCASGIARAVEAVYGSGEITAAEVTRIARATVETEARAHRGRQAASAGGFSGMAEILGDPQLLLWCPATSDDILTSEFWRSEELEWLARNGTPVQPASAAADRAYHAAVRGFLRCRGRCLAVLPALDGSQAVREHPVAVASRALLERAGQAVQTVPLARALEELGGAGAGSVVLREEHPVVALPSRGPTWELGKGTIPRRENPESPTSLEKLWKYPYGYVAGRIAGLRRASLGALASGPLLLGNVLHAAVAEYFTDGPGGAGDPERWIADRLPGILDRIGLPLLQPGTTAERSAVSRAIRSTISVLSREFAHRGATAVRFEVSPDPVTLGPIQVRGRVDVYATGRADPAVIDLKWGGATRRRREVAEGSDMQLSVYALLVGHGAGDLDIGYLIGSRGELVAHGGSGFHHAFEPEESLPTRESVPALLARLEETVRWRRDQLDAGTVELAPSQTAGLAPAPPGVLPRPDEADPYDDYWALLGWDVT